MSGLRKRPNSKLLTEYMLVNALDVVIVAPEIELEVETVVLGMTVAL